MTKKIYDLSDDDLVKLRTIKEYRDCPSEVEALRQCIRQTYRSDIDRLKASIFVDPSIPPNEVHVRGKDGKTVGKIVNLGDSQ